MANIVKGLAALGLATAAVSAAPQWLKVETPQVRLYSDASRRDVVEFAVQYSAFRQAFTDLVAPPGRRAAASTIVLFRRADTMRDYLANESSRVKNLISFNTTVDGAPLYCLGMDYDRREALVKILESDAESMLPRLGYFVPLWVSQGTGELLSTAHVAHGQCTVGEIDDRYTYPLAHDSWVPWPRFFEITQGSKEYRGDSYGNVEAVYYGQACALMHLVLLGPGGGAARLQELARKLTYEASDQEVVARVLGIAPSHLATEVHREFVVNDTKEFPVDDAKLRAAAVPTPAPEAEVRVEIAELMYADQDNLQADVQIDRARALSPHSALVHEALARQARRKGDLDAAADEYRQAIAAGSTDAQAYLVSATSHMNDMASNGMDQAGQGGDAAVAALAEVRKALQLQPGDGPTMLALARAYFILPTASAAEADDLTPALTDGEYGERVRLYRALLYQRLGRLDAYRGDLEQIISNPHSTARERSVALGQLQSFTFNADRVKVEALAQAGKFDAALAVIDSAVRRGGDAVDPDKYDHLRQTVERAQARAVRIARRQAAEAKAEAAGDEAPQLLDSGDTERAITVRVSAGNSHWSEFSSYIDTLAQGVLDTWNKAPGADKLKTQTGKVSVAFTLGADGGIIQVDRVEAGEGTSPALRDACVAAVKAAAPFASWNDEMSAQFGEHQHLMVTFDLH